MYVNNNLAALNAWGNLLGTENSLNTSIERLSSGLRINTAADGPAAFAIIQQMQGQVNGLNQADKNAQDGVSLIQTAEGALSQTENILQSMRQLAVQAASDTQTPQQRADIQSQINQFAKELTQISNTTQYNTMPILSGLFAPNNSNALTMTLQVGANKSQVINFNIGAMDAYTLQVATTEVTGVTFVSGSALSGTVAVQLDGNGVTLATYNNGADGNASIDLYTYGTYQIDFTSPSAGTTLAQLVGVGSSGSVAIGNAVTITGTTGTFTLGSVTLGMAIGVSLQSLSIAAGTDGTITVSTASSSAAAIANGSMVTNAVAAMGLSVSNQQDAENAITTLDNAIANVASQDATMGAMQDRLQFVMSNLTSASENLTAAQTRIQSTDMAKQMAVFSEQQVLLQSGTAMLYQANQIPTTILTLLR